MSAILDAQSDNENRKTEDESPAHVSDPILIQPHGILIAANADLIISHASQNCLASLGVEASDLLGRPLGSVFGAEWIDNNGIFLQSPERGTRAVTAIIDGQPYDVIIHHDNASTVLELEPVTTTPGDIAALEVYEAIHELTQATSADQLWGAAARALRRLTRFDRVMVYQLHPDGHGEIVAEETAEGLETHFGLHFTETDFPSGLRTAYLGKRSRMIVDSAAESFAVIGSTGQDAVPLTLGRAELRGVSPHDLYFMKALGHESILSLSLVHHGELIGVITLASLTPRVVPHSIRLGLEALANQVALQQSTMAEINRLSESMRRRGIRNRLMDQVVFGESTDVAAIADAFFATGVNVLDLVPADGAMICLGSHSASIGSTPLITAVRAAALRLGTTRTSHSLATASLAAEHPEVARLLPEVSGLILTPLPGFDGFIAWFRSESTRSVSWFGENSPTHPATPTSPQVSFPSWSQTISGESDAWVGLEDEADELARDLTVAMLRQAETQLATLAMRDSLTGLPNRRLLMDRIELSLATQEERTRLWLLFVDLDSFKSVNDTLGHDAGDSLLVEVARRILATTRSHDTVARLGGDEFVVLCTDVTREETELIASRIIDALRQPIQGRDGTMTVTASIGLAVAAPSVSAVELLRSADVAMYRAKALGRDQLSF